MQAKALLSGKDTMTKTENLNTHIVNTKIALAPAPTSWSLLYYKLFTK